MSSEHRHIGTDSGMNCVTGMDLDLDSGIDSSWVQGLTLVGLLSSQVQIPAPLSYLNAGLLIVNSSVV